MKTIHIEGKLVWKYGRTKRGNYVAFCDAIAQTVEAERFGELLEIIDEALESTFRELLSSGDLDKFLKDRGWSTSSPVPRGSRRGNIGFDMPFDLMGIPSRDLEEAVCQQAV